MSAGELHVIYDPVDGDQLSVPMTLAQCQKIEAREYEAQDQGDAWGYAIAPLADLARIQRGIAKRMSGNPPRKRIIFDGPLGK